MFNKAKFTFIFFSMFFSTFMFSNDKYWNTCDSVEIQFAVMKLVGQTISTIKENKGGFSHFDLSKATTEKKTDDNLTCEFSLNYTHMSGTSFQEANATLVAVLDFTNLSKDNNPNIELSFTDLKTKEGTVVNEEKSKQQGCDSQLVRLLSKKMLEKLISQKYKRNIGITYMKLEAPSLVSETPKLICQIPIEFKMVDGFNYQISEISVITEVDYDPSKKEKQKARANARFKDHKVVKKGNLLTDRFGEGYE